MFSADDLRLISRLVSSEILDLKESENQAVEVGEMILVDIIQDDINELCDLQIKVDTLLEKLTKGE